MRRFLIAALAGLAAIAGSAAQAATIFSEGFDAENGGVSFLNYTGFAQFTVANGIVDLVATPDFGITCAGGSGACVDLDGSIPGTDPTSSLVSDVINFVPGVIYTLSFDISGNQRNSNSDTTIYSISGGVLASTAITLAGGAPFQTVSQSFSVLSATLASIIFFTPDASDNIGLILDNVRIEATPIPLPAAAPIFLAGLAGLAFSRRRRAARA
jgi:hypothetical protein